MFLLRVSPGQKIGILGIYDSSHGGKFLSVNSLFNSKAVLLQNADSRHDRPKRVLYSVNVFLAAKTVYIDYDKVMLDFFPPCQWFIYGDW